MTVPKEQSEAFAARNEQILALLAKGHSAGQVAKIVGVTRNTVCGLRTRTLGTTKRPMERPTAVPTVRTSRKQKYRGVIRPSVDEVVADQLVRSARAHHAILDLTEQTCHWPIGDPLEEDFRYCLAVKIPGTGPYCPDHTKLARVAR